MADHSPSQSRPRFRDNWWISVALGHRHFAVFLSGKREGWRHEEIGRGVTWGFHIGHLDHAPPRADTARDYPVRDLNYSPISKPQMDHVSYIRTRNAEGWK